VSVSEKNVAVYEGGNFENGWVTAKVRSFGNYSVMLDTTPPKITPVAFVAGQNLSSAKSISFRISDNLAGVKSYRGTIDGKWVLFEHNAKTGTITHYFDKPLAPGKHQLKITVADKCDNVTVYDAGFTR
jgi:hypothetical protein